MILTTSIEVHSTVTTKGATDDHQPLIILKFCEKHNPIFVLLHRITESQNGRGWKGPLWVTQSNSLPKQGHPEQTSY